MDDEERCFTCRYYRGQSCKRHSPKLTDSDPPFETKWPFVNVYNWCGDWEKKEEEENE